MLFHELCMVLSCTGYFAAHCFPALAISIVHEDTIHLEPCYTSPAILIHRSMHCSGDFTEEVTNGLPAWSNSVVPNLSLLSPSWCSSFRAHQRQQFEQLSLSRRV